MEQEQEQQHHHHQLQAAGLPPQFTVSTTDVHPTSVANPTPTHPQLTPSHPSYVEMITSAIVWDSSQGKAGGSSKRAIAKYIDRVYTNLSPNHSTMLTQQLKRLKNSGQLVMIKNSYQLPVVAAAAASTSPAVPLGSAPPQQVQPDPANPTPKKRPGRPPKPKPLAQPSTEALAPPRPGVGNGPSTGKRPRGRPPRQQQPVVAEVPFVQPIPKAQVHPIYAPPDLGLNNWQQPVKRKPGRPFKNKQPAQPVYQAQVQPTTNPVVVPVNGTVPGVRKRRPGRPPKANAAVPVMGVAKPRGRPKRSALAPVAKPVGKKARGRPPRQAGMAPGVAGGKRRGRPPKGSVPSEAPPKPARNYVGKPRGRPKKNASIEWKPMSVAPNEEVLRKVENMQVTIRDALGVLRNCVPSENGDALMALQKLENLSTMNLTASPINHEPPMAAMSANVIVQVQPSTSVPAQDSVTAPLAATINIPTMVPPVVPFSIAAPTMTETAPFYAPPSSTIETQQPASWIPPSEAQL